MAILTVNSGSSSLKLGLFSDSGTELLLSASVSGIGTASAGLSLKDAHGETVRSEASQADSVNAAFEHALATMRQQDASRITAVGHRMVHGGPKLVTHQRLTAQVMQQLQDATHFAPLHIPPALHLVRFTETKLPDAPQFACFDTAFHQTMPPEAYTYPIPRAYRDAGIRRYGFHGLSYESIVHALGDNVPARIVICHLGSGSSACALLHGRSVDTSMGVSPTGGFPMSTRTGDLDPGVALLMERPLAPGVTVLTPDALERTVNHDSGMKALAGDGDMQKLVERASRQDPEAELAVAVFTREIAKTVAGYATVLGGLDLLVFTGGIGEHSAPVRARICERLELLSVALDRERNEDAHAPAVLSPETATVEVRVIPADENAMIALHVAALNERA